MEEEKQQSVYEDFKFVTRQELEQYVYVLIICGTPGLVITLCSFFNTNNVSEYA